MKEGDWPGADPVDGRGRSSSLPASNLLSTDGDETEDGDRESLAAFRMSASSFSAS